MEAWAGFSVCMCVCASAGVCVCVYLCAQVAVESHPRLICRHRCGTAAGVPVPGRSRAASFSQENAFNQSWVTAKQRRHLRNARNVPHHQRADLDIFISAIKKRTMRGKGGSKCKDRLRKEGMRGEEECQHLLWLHVLPK